MVVIFHFHSLISPILFIVFSLTAGMTVAMEENSDMNIISKGTTLMCTTIVSCSIMTISIMWYEHLLNGTNKNYTVQINETSSWFVEAWWYGNYTCIVSTTDDEMGNVTYALYGKTCSNSLV